MTESTPTPEAQPALIRHILPVVAGGAITVLLTVVTDNWLAVRGLLPTQAAAHSVGTLLFVLAYRGAIAIAGSHMAARLAPAGQPRIRYALALGGLLLVVNVINAMGLAGTFPTWFLLASVALQVPFAIIGGGTAVQAMARTGR
ncbi:MAG: hypothetical protein AB7H96_03650 [Vicinamibacterales bacterium]